MSTPLGRAAAAFVVLLLTAVAAAAQPHDILEWDNVRKAEHPASYESVQRRYEYLIAVRRNETLFLTLRDEVKDSGVWPRSDAIYKRLLAAFDEVSKRFVDFQFDRKIDAAADRAAADAVVNAFLDTKATGLFQLVNETWFGGRPYAITVTEVEALADERYHDFMHRVTTAERLLTDFRKPNRVLAKEAIERATSRWRQYVFDGRSQYPWEMVLNGSAIGPHSDIQHPPTRQWILAHPELGIETGTAGRGAANLTAKESMVVQALGHVWYRWPASDEIDPRWWGLSATVSLREEIRPGVGFTGHYGKVINVGVLWHDLDRDGNPFNETPYVFTGVDLFRLAKKHLPAKFMNRIDVDMKRIDKLSENNP